MPRGRPATSLKVLKLRGSKYSQKLPGPEPEKTAPQPPKWLKAAGRKVWDELVPELVRVGVLTKVDGVTFGVFCDCAGRYPECESPKELNEIRAMILRYAAEFGLTALARNRLRVTKPEKKSDEGKKRFFKATG